MCMFIYEYDFVYGEVEEVYINLFFYIQIALNYYTHHWKMHSCCIL